jgi:hypothetical protein
MSSNLNTILKINTGINVGGLLGYPLNLEASIDTKKFIASANVSRSFNKGDSSFINAQGQKEPITQKLLMMETRWNFGYKLSDFDENYVAAEGGLGYRYTDLTSLRHSNSTYSVFEQNELSGNLGIKILWEGVGFNLRYLLNFSKPKYSDIIIGAGLYAEKFSIAGDLGIQSNFGRLSTFNLDISYVSPWADTTHITAGIGKTSYNVINAKSNITLRAGIMSRL